MKLVYLAGPISKGDLVENINQGTQAFLALAKAGVAAICPMWSAYSGPAMRANGTYPQTVSVVQGNTSFPLQGKVFAVAGASPNELTHADWLKIDFEYIYRCDAMLRLPGESVGAEAEVSEALRIGVPVFHSIDDLIAWSKEQGAAA